MNSSDILSTLPGTILLIGSDARDFLREARECDDLADAKKLIGRADEILKDLIKSAEAAVAEMEEDDDD